MKNRLTVKHGMLSDLRAYLKQSGWKLEEPVGEYEVLRARNPNYPRPLLVHNRAERGVGYSIDGRDAKDFDDSVSLEQLENGNVLLGVDGNGTAASVASTQTGLRRKNGHGILKEWTEYEFQ